MADKIKALREQYIKQYNSAQQQLQQVEAQEVNIRRTIEQLRGAMIALDQMEKPDEPSTPPAPPVAPVTSTPAAAESTNTADTAAPAATSAS